MPKSSLVLRKPVKTPDMNLYQFFLRRPKVNAGPILSRCFSQELSFDQLKSESLKYAVALSAAGVKASDIVPIVTEPSNEALVMFFALNRLGAISTFLNNTASDAEINKYISDFSSTVIVVSKKLENRCTENRIKAKITIIMDLDGAIETSNPGIMSLSSLIQASSGTPLLGNIDTCGKSACAHISFTSGSTGAPKSIMLTNENIMAELISLSRSTRMQLGPKSRSLQVVPFNYPYGFIVSTLFHIYCGKTAVLTPGLTLKNISEYIRMYRPCYLNAIPSFYSAMINDPEMQKMDLSFIVYPVAGGDTLDSQTEKKFNQFLRSHGSRGVLADGYGNGEGCGCILNPAAVLRKYVSGSCGRPIYGLSLKLIDDKTGRPVPIGEIGRLCFSGTNVMAGYYQEGRIISDVFVTDENGRRWFYTDTYMHMNADLWMFIDGRDRRFFITFDEHGSPYKVYCDYVQKILLESCPDLQACAVVQKADNTRSLVPVCFLCFPGDNNSRKKDSVIRELKEKLKNVLPNCAIPVRYYLLDKLPLSQAGKVDYLLLEKIADEME